MSTDVRGLPPKICLVIRPTGERHYIDKLDDIAEWAKGLDVTIVEYRLAGIVHTPPQKSLDSRLKKAEDGAAKSERQ